MQALEDDPAAASGVSARGQPLLDKPDRHRANCVVGPDMAEPGVEPARDHVDEHAGVELHRARSPDTEVERVRVAMHAVER